MLTALKVTEIVRDRKNFKQCIKFMAKTIFVTNFTLISFIKLEKR